MTSALVWGFLLGNFSGLIIIAVTVNRHVHNDPHAEYSKWNEAVTNLRREWYTYKLSREEDSKRLRGELERSQNIMRTQLKKHIEMDHLDLMNSPTDSRTPYPRTLSRRETCNCGLALGHLPTTYCTNPGRKEQGE